MHRLKPMFFSNWLFSLIISYYRHIWMVFYLESWFSWLWGGMRKTLKNRRKQTEEKNWKVKRKKNKEHEESQEIKIHIFGLKFSRKYKLKKNCLNLYTMKFYLQFLCVAGYLKHSNDTPRLNIYKHTSYNIIEIYINRLSITTQIFILMDTR